jgi:hypothetical protein
MSTTAQIAKFEVGKTYLCRSICDYDWTIEVVARTAKMITIKRDGRPAMRRRVSLDWDGSAEVCYAYGKYFMCPVFRATLAKMPKKCRARRLTPAGPRLGSRR